MSRPRFLADHDLNEHIVDGLLRREPTVDIVRALADQLGIHRQDDSHILRFAAEQRRIVVSHDVNTMSAAGCARIERGESMPGLLMVRQREPIAVVIENLLLIWAGSELEE